MEYDFTYDVYGHPEARLSMGAEAFGRWLSETCRTTHAAAQLLHAAQQQQTAHRAFTASNHEATLSIEHGEVHIYAHGHDTDAERPQELDFYDAEGNAHCGIEDFIELVSAWHDFLNT